MAQIISNTRIKNAIYQAISKLTSHIYRDDDWQAVRSVLAEIRYVLSNLAHGYQLIVSVENGGYRSNESGTQWKEYQLAIENADGKEVIGGTLNAHAAGKMNDPFSSYDMSVVLW